MVLFIPGNKSVEGLKLAPARQLLLGRLGEKAAAMAGADDGVNLLEQRIGKNNMCTSVHGHKGGAGNYGLYLAHYKLNFLCDLCQAKSLTNLLRMLA